MYDTGYEIGINEISNLTRKLSWDSEMSHRAFLQSVATQFDNAELDYEVVLNSDFTVQKRLVHIKKKIGEVRDDIELRYGENIKTVKRSTNIDNLYTAIKPISKDDNGKVTDISSMPDWQKLDDNGNVVLSHKQGSQHILAPQANARFGNKSTGGYVVYDYSYDKVSQSDLFNRSVAKLEEISVPAINYEVEGRTGAKIGDTVKIIDDGYTPELILSARVLEQVISFDDATAEQAIFGNYKALQSQISADLIAKMQQLAEENAPYKAQTLTTNGLTFKNSSGSTTLTARLYKGTKEIVPDKFVWSIGDVISDNETNQFLVNADDINVKSVVRWSAVINDIAVAFDEVTITDVSDGTNGISPTVTVNPDTSLTIVDAKGTITTPVLKGSDGTNGTSGIIVSSVAPDSPQTGQLWQDTSIIPQLVKKWTGSSWVIWEFYAENIKAVTLETLSAKIGKIYNEFDNSSGGIDNKGTITIEDSVKVVYYLGNSSTTIDLVTSSSGQGLFTQYLPDKTDASKFKQSWYMPTGLYFTDSINNWNGQITAENVTLVPWTNLTYLPGFTTAENNPCQYRKIKNLDGSYTVQFRGQIKPSSGSFAVNSTSYVASIPSDIMPLKNAFGIGIPDFNTSQNVRLVVVADLSSSNPRQLQIKVTGGATSYVSLDMLEYAI